MASLPQDPHASTVPLSTAPSPSSSPAKKAKLLTMTPSLEAALHNLNLRYCLVEHLPAIASIPTLTDPDLHIYSRGEFINTLHGNRFADGRNVAQEWVRWPKQKRATKLTYAPGKPEIHNSSLNTWIPSSITPKKGKLTYWENYLNHIFSSDPTHREWFEAWLAYQFQHPGVKLHTATVFWSNQTSTGKSLFGYIMGTLFGENNFAEIGEGDLHGAFNYWAARKQFVMGEEIRGANAQKQADSLKAIITRKTVTINTKNTPHYTLPDCINYFFTSNHSDAFFLDRTDRRFFVHELGPEKLKADYVNHEFMPWLKQEGYASILYWLLNTVDLKKPVYEDLPFNPFGAAPQTRARSAMIEAGREEVDVWLEYLVSSGNDIFYGTPKWKLATAEDLHEQFRTAYPHVRVTYRSFVSRLRAVCPMVRGGNAVHILEGEPAKRIYCPPAGLRVYERATEEELISSYTSGRDS